MSEQLERFSDDVKAAIRADLRARHGVSGSCPTCDHERTFRGPCVAYVRADALCNCVDPWHFTSAPPMKGMEDE